ncbi:uncharacterized protein LOC128552521 [Mercenaria mercenaria]|uniref:uncharacterized protein LOC128552521 n=1 Tax=Mercenaria mercenaria TaxID=6596 RepID=UPI00234E83FA|nr:uncharacterized protein LOC128552521 [Mercenaria mercenaria]
MICGKVGTFSPAIVAEGITSVFSFGLDIYGIIESFKDDNSHRDDSKYEELKKDFTDKIAALTSSISAKIDMQDHFDRLFEISKFINALLIDIENIIQSKTKEARDENIKRFKYGFKEHEAEIQQIARLLTASIPVSGLSKPSLKDALVEMVDCNLTSLKEFMDYYMDLVSTAFAIDLTNECFNVVDLSNQTKSYWTDEVEILFAEFESQKNGCIARFPQLVKDDLAGDENATDLQKENALRYSDKLNSVVYVGSDTCGEIKYLENRGNIFSNTTARKFVLFEKKYENDETVNNNATEVENNSTKSFPTEPDILRLKSKIEEDNCDTGTISKAIYDMFYWRGYTLSFMLVMDDKPQNQLAIDPSSLLTLIKACGKVILIRDEEVKTTNASSLDYKTVNMKAVTSGVSVVTVNTTFIVCLISYLVVLFW